jgi:hypothetical protein
MLSGKLKWMFVPEVPGSSVSSICPFVRKLGLWWCAFEPNVKVQGVISRCGICNGGIADPSTHAGDAASTNAIAI